MKYDLTFQPAGKTVQVREGTSVLNAARHAGIYIPTRCGGKMGCLMCKIDTSGSDRQSLSPASEAEKRKLGSLIHNGVRLSCQAQIRGPVTVTVPEDKLKAAIRKQLEAAKHHDNENLW